MVFTRSLRPLSRILCVATLLWGLAAVPATAQTSRLYFAGYMGLNSFDNLDFSEKTAPAAGHFKPKNAFSFAGALGLRIDNNWRVEGELSYRTADLGRVSYNNGQNFKAGGQIATYLAMANVYYDFDLDWKKLTPYVTAGLGVAYHDTEIISNSALAPNVSDSDFSVAWQLGTGLKYRVADNMAFSGGYRYLGTTQMGIGGYDIDYNSHEFRVGLEYDLPVK